MIRDENSISTTDWRKEVVEWELEKDNIIVPKISFKIILFRLEGGRLVKFEDLETH